MPTIEQLLQQSKPISDPHQRAYLTMLAVCDRLSRSSDQFFKQHNITQTQYNALRIIVGMGDKGIPSLLIANRLLTKVPDVVRLLDRIEKLGYITRERSETDRRVVLAKATETGEKLVRKLHHPLLELHQQQLQQLPVDQLQHLTAQLEHFL